MPSSWCDKCDGLGAVKYKGRYVKCRCCRGEGVNFKRKQSRGSRRERESASNLAAAHGVKIEGGE